MIASLAGTAIVKNQDGGIIKGLVARQLILW
jgi:hypothetical protein